MLRYMANFSLTPGRGCSIYVLSLLVRGVSGDDPEGGAGIGVPRLRLVTVASGGFGNRSPGTMTRAARSLLHVLQRKCWGRKRGPEAKNRQGRSAERRGVPIARDAGAPRKRPGLQRHCRPTGASQAPGACRRSAHPSLGWTRFKTRAPTCRGNVRCCVLGCLTL